MPTACIPCRLKKIRCDGGFPQCESCEHVASLDPAHAVECKYQQGKATANKIKYLRKGAACGRCRRQKMKRCNATRPVCDTCKSVGKKEECIYSANLFSNHQSRHMPRRIRPALSSDQNHSLIPHLREASVDNVRSTKNVLEPDACATAVTSNSTSPKSYYSSLPEFPASEQTAFLSQPEPLLSYGGEPAVLAPEMLAISPRQVLDCGKTTNPLDPFDLSLSYVALEDMNLTFRLFFLGHTTKLGMYLPFKRQHAILFGDLSNNIIDNFFVYFAHAIGCQLYRAVPGVFPYLYHQAICTQMLWEALLSLHADEDPFGYVQVHQALASGFLCICVPTLRTRRLLVKSIATAQKYQLRFVCHPGTQQIPNFSDEVHERVVCLSQLIYLQICLNLLDKRKEVPLYDLEKQFEQDLPAVYPFLFRMSPIILRTRSMMYARDARQLIVDNGSEDLVSSMWRCEGLIRNLASHIIDIEGVIANFEQLQGQCALVSLKSSLIISSISLAEIYDLFATRDSYRERLFNALERGVHVTSSLGDDDVNFLDPFIQVYWPCMISILEKHPSLSLMMSPSYGLGAQEYVSRMLRLVEQKVQLDNASSKQAYKEMSTVNIQRPEKPNLLTDDTRLVHGL